MPRYYPICVDLSDLPCLVVGGGEVGLRKVRTLLDHGARVTVVAQRPNEGVREFAEQERIVFHERRYQKSDIDGMRLVFVATNDAAANRQITTDAREAGILINVADVPEHCDFIVPSIVRRGSLMLAISTEGACPAYSKRLRKQLEGQFDDAFGEYVELLGRLRRQIIDRLGDPKKSAVYVRRFLDQGLLEIIRDSGLEAAESKAGRLLDSWLQEHS